MATVGQALTAPEAGWKRYDDNNSNITYIGNWYGKNTLAPLTGSEFPDANNSYAYGLGTKNCLYADGTQSLEFNFIGTKLRIIGYNEGGDYGANLVDVIIDGVKVGDFTQKTSAQINQCLNFSIEGLSNNEHFVVVTPTNHIGFNDFLFDAIDIDETGELKPYSPIEMPSFNLTASAGDTKVTLSWTAVTGATGYNVKRSTTAGGPYTTIASNVSDTSYVDTAVTTGTTYYYVVTAITTNGESANSNEVSATPIAVPIENKQVLLRITMIDSSEREYQLPTTEIDGYISWFNQHTITSAASYMLNKKIGLQSSKEYLAFDKIISFEVIPVA